MAVAGVAFAALLSMSACGDPMASTDDAEIEDVEYGDSDDDLEIDIDGKRRKVTKVNPNSGKSSGGYSSGGKSSGAYSGGSSGRRR